jgi:release factor glutamine methyltransferase
VAALEPISGTDGRIEAEMLFAHAIGIDRAHLLACLAETLPADVRSSFDALLARRVAREPLAYILGHREFYGIEIACSPAALIPRSESEMLVEIALEVASQRTREVRVADVGTGTGAIAIAIAANAANARVIATDVSGDALALARRNIDRCRLSETVTLHRGDLLDGVGTFNVIVANLPYVSEADWRELPPELRDHEPRGALVGGENGLEVIERLLHEMPSHLAPGGVLAAEVGDTQGSAALAIGKAAFPDAGVSILQDLAGLDRVLLVRSQGVAT